MFNSVSKTMATFFQPLRATLNTLFLSRTIINEEFFRDLEKTLIEADLGRTTTQTLLETLKKGSNKNTTNDELNHALTKELSRILKTTSYHSNRDIYIMIGINGTGKTTASAKLAHHLMQQGKKVLLVAADTFRAAATEQLSVWAERYNIPLVTGTHNQDPAALLFNAIQTYRTQSYDVLIIDTAGRLHTNTNLMAELAKMKRVIHRHVPEKRIATLLTLDALLGQNSLEQARLFNEAMQIDGLVLTKLDSSSKGGIVYALANQLHVPVAYLSYGENINDLAPFDATSFINNMFPSTKD